MAHKYDDFDRMLQNWARWLNGGEQRGGIAPFPAYNLGPRPPRYGNTMPMINGEAVDLDKAIKRIPKRYQQSLEVDTQDWLYPTQVLKARRCGVCVKTYKARLDDAKAMAKREYYQPRKIVNAGVPILC